MVQHHAAFRWALRAIGVALLMLPPFTLAQSNVTVSPLPTPTGPYQVGTSLFHWVDDTRFEIIPALVAGNFLQPGTAVAKSPPVPIKSEATSRADTLVMLDAGQPLVVTEIEKGWAHVEYDDSEGWARANRLINVETKRELMIQVWYPADVDAEATPAPYVADSSLTVSAFNTVLEGFYHLALDPDLAAALEFPSHAFPDAPIASAQSSYPVLIFSHGLGGFPALYSAQLEEMASHGYIVFAIFHTYLTPITIFPDGQILTFILPESSDSYPGVEVHRVASEDQIFVANRLQTLNNDTESIFAGKMNLGLLGVFGHSLGGSAGVFSCYHDRRFRACLNEDGFSNLLYEMDGGILQPFMFMQKPGNPVSIWDAAYGSAPGPGYNLIIDGFGHLSFADFTWGPLSSRDGEDILHRIWIGDVEGMRATQIVRAYLLAFFDTYLKGEDNALLDGPSADYPEVNFQFHNIER